MSWLRFALCSFLLTVPALGSMGEVADKIYYGGDILTADDSNPHAEAVAVDGGRIMRVGALSEVVRLRGANTELVDLDGRTLAPAFIDAWGQLSVTGLHAVCANLLPPPEGRNTSISVLQETLRLWMSRMRMAGASGPVIGFGYSESQFTAERQLTRTELDAVSMDFPVIAIHRSGNRGVFNSKALRMAGIGAATPDPYGGKIRRYFLSDVPNGVLEDKAHHAALARVLSRLGKEAFRGLINAAQDLYVELGHTTAQDSGTHRGALAAYPELAAMGRLRIDVVAYPDLLAFGDEPILSGPLHSREYTNGFRIGGVTLRLHGAKREETARLRQSYLRLAAGPVKSVSSRAGFDDEEAAALVASAFGKGWQVLAAASDDGAIDQFIKAVRTAPASGAQGGRRPVLILRKRLRPDQADDIRALEIVPAFAPGRALSRDGTRDDKGAQHDRRGREWVRPRGDAGQRGLAFQGGNSLDLPPPPPRPMDEGTILTAYPGSAAAAPDALKTLSELSGQSADAAGLFGTGAYVTRQAAFKAVTLWAAYQLFEEETKGSIEAGKLADLVILSGNPVTADADKIAGIEVVETIKEGETIYLASDTPHTTETSLACSGSEKCRTGLTASLARLDFVPPERRDSVRVEAALKGDTR